ncbi:MAG: hypothetical protein GYA35_04650 [Thermoanaerobaculaceae bacterium]|nr:hypothetical protein [Thermoanaerobaculaceae bacterium]
MIKKEIKKRIKPPFIIAVLLSRKDAIKCHSPDDKDIKPSKREKRRRNRKRYEFPSLKEFLKKRKDKSNKRSPISIKNRE